jgi:hypothetical protein
MDDVRPVLAPAKPTSPKDFERHWKSDGTAYGHAPKWAKYRTEMTSEFPLPWRQRPPG